MRHWENQPREPASYSSSSSKLAEPFTIAGKSGIVQYATDSGGCCQRADGAAGVRCYNLGPAGA